MGGSFSIQINVSSNTHKIPKLKYTMCAAVAQRDQFVEHMAHTEMVAMLCILFPLHNRASLWKKSDKPVNVSSTRRLYLNYSSIAFTSSSSQCAAVVGSKGFAYNKRDTSQTSMRAHQASKYH